MLVVGNRRVNQSHPGTNALALACESLRAMHGRPHPMTEVHTRADRWALGFEAGLNPELADTRNADESWREGYLFGRQCSELCAHRDRFELTLDRCNGPADLGPKVGDDPV